MDVPRKRAPKYGKSSRKALVHDLFDVSSRGEKPLYTSVHSAAPSRRLETVSRSATPADSDVSEDPEVSVQIKRDLLADLDANKPRLKSPARRGLLGKPQTLTSTSTFEIESSDEGPSQARLMSRTYKRRKLTPTGSDEEQKPGRGRQEATALRTRGTSVGNIKTNVRTHRKSQSMPRGSEANTAALKKGSNVSKMTSPEPVSHSLKPRTKPRPTTIATTPTSSRVHTPSPRTPTDIGSPGSDISAASMVTTRSATKRKRDAADVVHSDLSSPSQLELSSLRLTPRKGTRAQSRSAERSLDEMTSDRPRNVRARLADRLNAVVSTQGDEDLQMVDHSQEKPHVEPGPSKSRADTPQAEKSPRPSTLLGSPQKERGADETVRPRKYGKQRSHLREMVTRGYSQGQDSSQQSLQSLMSQVDVMTSSQQSQFEIEISSDDDDDEDSSQLKSIHELRQAGAINRYDRDLDSLYEDITSGIKGVRISGLMQLVRKLKDQVFKRHLLDSGRVGRLIACITPDLDTLSASIMLLSFWTLAHSGAATAHLTTQLYQGIMSLPPNLIAENRPMARIARDRNENLSRALIADITDFEGHILDKSASAGRQTNHIVISRIAIRSIESLLRKLLDWGQLVPVTPRPWTKTAIKTITWHFRTLASGDEGVSAEHVESIRLILAWLDLSEASAGGIGEKLSATEIHTFGRLLGPLLGWAQTGNAAIEQSCLKLAVELSNRSKEVAEVLAESSLVDSVYQIVDTEFPKLADEAMTGAAAAKTGDDPDKLTSVILALGCLLHLADSSEVMREKSAAAWKGSESQVDRLVALYRLYVDETDEVSPAYKTLESH
jgi:hypothetical protein